MQAQKAFSLGVRSTDVRITSSGAVWHVWVPSDTRPNGRQPLTEGDIYSVCRWLALLERFEREDEVHLPEVLANVFGVSRSEARRVMAQGGVKLDGTIFTEMDAKRGDLAGRVLSFGKRRAAVLEAGDLD